MGAMKSLPKIILASTSPRRRQLLEALGIQFEVRIPTGEETHPTEKDLEKVILENSKIKANSLLAEIGNEDAIVVGADTLVALDGKVLGKPADKADAEKMLRTLSGKTQMVVTGLSLLSKEYGSFSENTKSYVTFKKLSDSLIADYLDTKEPWDRAGSYAVQGMGALFIEKIEGSYTNVMGLPIETFLEILQRFGFPLKRWFQ